LQTTALDAQQSEFIRLLRQSAKILRSLVDDVLDISKIESGRLAISTSDFDLHVVINELVRTLRVNAKAKGIELYAVIDPHADYLARRAAGQLHQGLVKRLRNTIKHTESGEVVLELKGVNETVDAMRLAIEVRDSGVGISTEDQRRIFDRFVQADTSRNR